MSLELRARPGGFGAEVIGVDPTLQVDEDAFRRIEEAWYRSSVLIFRDLAMTPEQQIAFSRRLGTLHIMTPAEFNLPAHPEVFVVSNAERDGRPIGLRRAGYGYHTDGEDKSIPNAGSFLYAREVPPTGGDTIYVDMYAVYEALPDDVRRTIAGRRARFSRTSLHQVHYPHLPPLTPEQARKAPDVYHPLARRHPRTGRTSLYVGRWACDVEGLPEAEGRALVEFLQRFAQEPRFEYRHVWRAGDAVLWDNRCTQHCATGFDEARYVRLMHRTTLEGEVPIMADAVPAGSG